MDCFAALAIDAEMAMQNITVITRAGAGDDD
jgi:hypothetical protein